MLYGPGGRPLMFQSLPGPLRCLITRPVLRGRYKVSEHGEVVSGESAHELVGAGGWHGEVDFLSRAGIQQTRFRKHSVIALGDPRCARTRGRPVGGYSVFGPVLDQYPVVLVDGRRILENHRHRITRFGLQLGLAEFQTITIGGYRKRARSGVR